MWLLIILMNGFGCQTSAPAKLELPAPHMNAGGDREASTSAFDSLRPKLIGRWWGKITDRETSEDVTIVMDFTPIDSAAGALRARLYVPLWGETWWSLRLAQPMPGGLNLLLDDNHGRIGIFDATFVGSRISGTYEWGGLRHEFQLSRERMDEDALAAQRRIQIPTGAVPYRVEAVRFSNGELNLTAGMRIPEGRGPYPCVLLLPGSQPGAWTPAVPGPPTSRVWMWVIADALARRGVASLQMDPRGIGGSGGRYDDATISDLADDAVAALHYMVSKQPAIDGRHIGVLGLSEGAIVAPLAAARATDVAFVTLISAPAVPLDEFYLEQVRRRDMALELPQAVKERNAALAGHVIQMAKGDFDIKQIVSDTARRFSNPADAHGSESREAITRLVLENCTPLIRSEIRYDPRAALAALRVPVLALYGAADSQLSAQRNAEALREALHDADNQQVKLIVFPDLGHTLNRRGSATQDTIDPFAIDALLNWVVENTTKQVLSH